VVPPSTFDWDAFSNRLFDELANALIALGREEPGPVYVVALWGGYRELGALLSLPLLAVNTEARGSPGDGGFWCERWSPADWAYDDIELSSQALALEQGLTAEATRGSVAQWRETERHYEAVLMDVVQRLHAVATEHLRCTPDFVCFIHAADGTGPDVARKTIPAELFATLFSVEVKLKQDKQAMATRPPAEQAAYWVTRFGAFGPLGTEDAQEALVALGPDATAALVATLDDPKVGWTAAMVLARMRLATPSTVAALRERAEQHLWHAMALGMLGDGAWLQTQSPSVAVRGLTAPLRAIASGDGPPPKLDYAPLREYLATADTATVELVEQTLKPGSSYAGIVASDVSAALEGLTSSHAVIRWHAASVLGDRALGDDACEAILAALPLDDPHPLVRRLAALSIGRWRASARSYREDLERLMETDVDEHVQRAAKTALSML